MKETCGEPLWEEEFDTEALTSSPTMIGKYLYLFGRDGKCFVVEPTPEKCIRVAESDLGQPCVTSPAVVDGGYTSAARPICFVSSGEEMFVIFCSERWEHQACSGHVEPRATRLRTYVHRPT